MLRRSLTILPFVTLVLALLMAVPAWAAPNLTITKEGPESAEPGEEFVYSVTVRNTGADPATAVVVTDRLPEGVTFLASDPAGCIAATDAQGRVVVTCDIATLDSEGRRTFDLRVEAPTDSGEITNRASVESATTERETSNAVTTLVASRLVINKLGDPEPVREEGLLEYTLRVTNQGDLAANNVVILDDLPLDDVDFVRLSEPDDFTCDYDSGLVRCDGDIPAGKTRSVEILVEAEKVGTIENTARVRSGSVSVDSDTEETVVEARAEENNDNDTNDDTNDDTTDDTSDDTSDTTDTTDTTDDTTTTDTSTAPAEATTAETQTADGVNSEADAFRCDFFLHVVRDEQGGVRDQYRDDELIVRRFEQCLSEDVLTGTIPNRNLPGTGGPALLGLAALGLASLVAGASVLRAGFAARRRR